MSLTSKIKMLCHLRINLRKSRHGEQDKFKESKIKSQMTSSEKNLERELSLISSQLEIAHTAYFS